jgi:protein-L-isoaspartate O-methyltransferase
VPSALKPQVALGGRPVMLVGRTADSRQLLRLTRSDEMRFKTRRQGGVRFVRLIGAQGRPD